jgi:hypothetical protein
MIKLLKKHCRGQFAIGFILLLCQSSYAAAEIGDAYFVTKDNSRLRSLPSTEGTVLLNMKRGQLMTELLRNNNWVNVKLSNKDLSGWVYEGSIKPVVQETKKLQEDKKPTSKTAKNEFVQQMSLVQLGYKNGIIFEGSSANHARKLYFQVPQDIGIQQGIFRIHYLYSPLLESHSNLRVYINGSPRKIVRLGSELHSGWLEVKLSAEDLLKRFIQVELKSAMLISKDRCFDERVGGAYLQILPDSKVQWHLQGDIASIRSYWQLLPKQVSVTLPQEELQGELFRNALGLTQQLLRSGHQVTYTRLPVMGDIVIAPEEQIFKWIEQQYKDLPANSISTTTKGKNIALINLPDRQFLALWGAHDTQTLSFLSDSWHSLAAAGGYQLYTGAHSGSLMDESYALKLQDLGMDTGLIEMSDQASWSSTINPSQLPPGHRLHKVRIQLITAPSASNKPMMFYVYLNSVLIKAVRLKNTGESQEIVLSLPKREMQRSNNLQFVAQRDLSDLDLSCSSETMQYPIQIKPQSTIETILDTATPEQFANLPLYLSRGYDTFLPQAYLKQAEKVLPYLSSMLIDMDLPLMAERMKFYKPEEMVSPVAPFVLLGKTDTTFDKQSVMFGKGRIDILDQHGNVLLAVDALPKISIAQIVRSGDVYGLWLMPPDKGPLAPIKEMSLSKDDVAFADENGVLLTLDSTQIGLARVDYPQKTSWFELFGEYRFWYFAIGWLLLTSLIIYLYRLSRSHRKN